MWSVFAPIPAGGLFPLVIAVVLIAFVRSFYLRAGGKAALSLSIIFLSVPLGLYGLYHSLTSDTPTSKIIGKLLPGILVLLVVLVVIGIVYTIAKIEIPIVPPEINHKRELSLILKDIKTHFSFLLEKSYQISHLEYVDHPLGGWHFQLDAPDDKLSIVLDEQLKTLLVFGKEETDRRDQILLDAMIYHLTERKVFIGNRHFTFTPSRSRVFRNEADLLKTYINQIENYRRDNIETTRNELSNLQKQYIDALDRESERRRKIRQPPGGL